MARKMRIAIERARITAKREHRNKIRYKKWEILTLKSWKSCFINYDKSRDWAHKDFWIIILSWSFISWKRDFRKRE